jgi:hypothetical protein
MNLVMLRNSKQFLLYYWYPSCTSCLKPCDKSWMKKATDCYYDERNISVEICDTSGMWFTRGSVYSGFTLYALTLSWECDLQIIMHILFIFLNCDVSRFSLNKHLSILNTNVGPREVRFRQVSLYNSFLLYVSIIWKSILT